MKKFISVEDVTDINALVKKALNFKADPLRNKTFAVNKRIGLLFLNPSMRTRLSTQIAAANLGVGDTRRRPRPPAGPAHRRHDRGTSGCRGGGGHRSLGGGKPVHDQCDRRESGWTHPGRQRSHPRAAARDAPGTHDPRERGHS